MRAPVNPVAKVHPITVVHAFPYATSCRADFAGYGACIQTTGHDGPHRDVNGHGWTDEHTNNMRAFHAALRAAATATK